MSSPMVGITAWRRELDTYLGREKLQTLSAYYTNSVLAAGMVPIILPNGQDPANAPRLVEMVDGLVLSGGDDVSPETYNEAVSHATGTDRDVDRFEIALVEAAREQNKPVLAICRGLQLLNVALGGTINQEITRSGTVHEPFDPIGDPTEVNQRRHVVSFSPGSLLADTFRSEELKVNTLHHQGIAVLAPPLVAEGTTEDGLVEAARCEGAWWALGVQWHPERMELADQAPLFSAFRSAIESD
jgi:putative glutamine amidotransferase